MIPLLLAMPDLANRVLAASAALWCVAGIAAGLQLRVTDAAPIEPALAWPEVDSSNKDDRLTIDPPAAFSSRWLLPVVEAAAARTDVPQTVGATVSARSRHKAVDRVCGDHGRTYFRRHGREVWRCNRRG